MRENLEVKTKPNLGKIDLEKKGDSGSLFLGRIGPVGEVFLHDSDDDIQRNEISFYLSFYFTDFVEITILIEKIEFVVSVSEMSQKEIRRTNYGLKRVIRTT